MRAEGLKHTVCRVWKESDVYYGSGESTRLLTTTQTNHCMVQPGNLCVVTINRFLLRLACGHAFTTRRIMNRRETMFEKGEHKR